jgi:hypothetical protein
MKISIKREQSQTSLSFAEREKFRPQVKQAKLWLLKSHGDRHLGMGACFYVIFWQYF